MATSRRRYYPKLQSSIPFTPATGPRLLALDPNEENINTLLDACIGVAQKTQVSSMHMTFMPKDQWDYANQSGFLSRIDQQFHWHNAGYQGFDSFSQTLPQKRKNLKRERRTLWLRTSRSNGQQVTCLTSNIGMLSTTFMSTPEPENGELLI